MPRQIFVNLPVKDLGKSIAFFTKLGFTFNPKFTDKNATCMIIGENIFSMLIIDPYFKTFTKKEISDTKNKAEVIVAVSVDSREEVNAMVNNALAAGGKESMPKQDYGWMYNWSFQDIDGHLWEVLYMDETNMPQAPAAGVN